MGDSTFLLIKQKNSINTAIKTMINFVTIWNISIPDSMKSILKMPIDEETAVVRTTRKWKSQLKLGSKKEKSGPIHAQIPSLFKRFVQNLRRAIQVQLGSELFILVEVIFKAYALYPKGYFYFIRRLVRHCETLSKIDENLCISILNVFEAMLIEPPSNQESLDHINQSLTSYFKFNALSKICTTDSLDGEPRSVVFNYFSKISNGWHFVYDTISSIFNVSDDSPILFQTHSDQSSNEYSKSKLQCLLESNGVCQLIINLATSTSDVAISEKAIYLAVRLLDGGNTNVQNNLLFHLQKKESELFLCRIYSHLNNFQSFLATSTDGITPNPRQIFSSSSDIPANLTPYLVRKLNDNITNSSEPPIFDFTFLESNEDSLLQTLYSTPFLTTTLRFLQLLCENHNRNLQDFLREQKCYKNSYNMVQETLSILDSLCGGTTGSLGLLGLFIDVKNISVIMQCIDTLIEFCQGPCPENQNVIAASGSNGLSVVISMIMNDITPLASSRMDLVLTLKISASKLLLALVESRMDSVNAERIVSLISIKNILSLSTAAFLNKKYSEEEKPKAIEFGHNLYILAYYLSLSLKTDLRVFSQPVGNDQNYLRALAYYERHTAKIEIVRHDRSLETIIFAIPEVCNHLSEFQKSDTLNSCKVDDENSKVSDFFSKTDFLYSDMIRQKKLQEKKLLNTISGKLDFLSDFSLFMSVLLNFIIALFYPFTPQNISEVSTLMLNQVYIILALSSFLFLAKKYFYSGIVISLLMIAKFSNSFLLGLVVVFLGSIQCIARSLFLVSFLANKVEFNFDGLLRCFHNFYFLIGIANLLLCFLGTIVHPFFFAALFVQYIINDVTLMNVIQSVTRNVSSIFKTGILAFILIYYFSIIGYLYLQEDFKLPIDKYGVNTFSDPNSSFFYESSQCLKTEETNSEPIEEYFCTTMFKCLYTVMNKGLRSGGGIGDVLKQPSFSNPNFSLRFFYDLLFYLIIIVIILNLVFGVIIDTFADLREEKAKAEEINRNTCFICGLNRSAFENKDISFESHCLQDHNIWCYLYFIVHLKVTEITEFTGPESYVFKLLTKRDLSWFPRLRCIALSRTESVSDTNEQLHQIKEFTLKLHTNFTEFLNEFRTIKEKSLLNRKTSFPRSTFNNISHVNVSKGNPHPQLHSTS